MDIAWYRTKTQANNAIKTAPGFKNKKIIAIRPFHGGYEVSFKRKMKRRSSGNSFGIRIPTFRI